MPYYQAGNDFGSHFDWKEYDRIEDLPEGKPKWAIINSGMNRIIFKNDTATGDEVDLCHEGCR